MGYYTRVLCVTKNKPTVQNILCFLTANGVEVRSNLNERDLQTKDWNHFELVYDENSPPLLVELNLVGNSDGLAEEELEELLGYIGTPNFYELKKKKVIGHLKRTKYIICVQLPIHAMKDKGHDVNGKLMQYFQRNFSGMIQIDRKGFYNGSELLLEL
ncbi:hypothetical protein F8C76_01630 [Flagellimonas olearia]|uniref:Uncharacterized protein n=1 Tax=Flagellimonas olearia TaxID=552546 RepID=A0A6I1DXI9_9FLAO|nr:hypothetical protein [Allomuricauda olearia]KAB7530236.1 hypothetical protein F8C76_01630 [Allomuricauda olearia]